MYLLKYYIQADMLILSKINFENVSCKIILLHFFNMFYYNITLLIITGMV